MLLFKKSFLIVCLLSASAVSFAQVTEKWVNTQTSDPDSDDAANGLVVDHKGNVYVTGKSIGKGTGNDFATIKYDEDGNKKWTKRYNGPGNGEDVAVAIAADHKGNIYVTGWSATGTGPERDYTTIKYDDLGNTKWIESYNGPGNELDEATAIVVDRKGNVYVTGRSRGNGTDLDYATIKYDHDGDKKWVRRYNGPGNSFDAATAITVDDNGNVYVTGSSIGNETANDYATIKYDADGNLQWVQRYNGLVNRLDRADAVVVDDKGYVYVTGMTTTFWSDDEDDVDTDMATIKYNAQGAVQWVGIYDNEGADEGKAIAVDDAGNVFITGVGGAPDETFYRSFSTIKYNEAGIQQWAQTVTPTGRGSEAEVHDLVLDAAGNVYVTGGVENEHFYDYVTIRYNTNGQQQWKTIYNGPGNGIDIATAIGIDKKGNVYVTGRSRGILADDYATIKYNAAGVQQWVRRYNGPGVSQPGGTSNAVDLALDTDGNIYVTGYFTGADFATYKYDNDGNIIWKKIYNSPATTGTEGPIAIVLDTKGNVYVTGTSAGSGTGDDFTTIKYNQDGETEWIKTYNGPANGADQATSIAVDKQGNTYVTGSSEGIGVANDFAIVKYDKHGNTEWVKRYNGPGNSIDEGASIAVDDAGNVYVTGFSFGIGSSDYATIKYDKDGNQLWVARYDGPVNGTDRGNALVLDASGNVYVTGLSQGSSFAFDYATIKYNTAGVQQWVARYNGPVSSFNEAKDLAVDASSNVYVTGGSGDDYVTVKYNAAGVQQWATSYNGPTNGYDFARDLTLDAYGNVYVTGESGGDFATVKYNATGVEQWVARHAGGAAFAIAVDGNGNVYVTGSPYTTIKYEQTPVLTRSSTDPELNKPAVLERGSVQLTAKAFPNAFTEFINLQWSGSDKPATITITDAMGRLIEKRTGLAFTGTIQTGYHFPPGIYYAEIVQGNEKVVLKLVRQ